MRFKFSSIFSTRCFTLKTISSSLTGALLSLDRTRVLHALPHPVYYSFSFMHRLSCANAFAKRCSFARSAITSNRTRPSSFEMARRALHLPLVKQIAHNRWDPLRPTVELPPQAIVTRCSCFSRFFFKLVNAWRIDCTLLYAEQKRIMREIKRLGFCRLTDANGSWGGGRGRSCHTSAIFPPPPDPIEDHRRYAVSHIDIYIFDITV